VFYAHDGQNLFDAATSFSGEWGIDECLDSLYSKGYKTSIVVGIDNGGIYRIEELTPWPNPKYGGGKADLYSDFIVKTLKPYIDSNYRTLPDQKHTGIFGSSLGGVVSFYIGLKYPEVFSKIGVFSPAFWFSEESYKLAGNFKKKKPIKIYITGGAKEADNYEAEIIKMKQILTKGKIKPSELKVEVIPDGKHNEWFWRREFPKVYLWLMGNSK
jgi:predicted alpha/beta superfamily hydrolase